MYQKYLPLFLMAGLVSACAGGPTAPYGPAASRDIAGTWTGTITLTRPTLMTVPTTWTFTKMNESGLFEARATWNGTTSKGISATASGAQFAAAGTFPSSVGCDGDVAGTGTSDPHVIESTFLAFTTCDVYGTFDGHMTLKR